MRTRQDGGGATPREPIADDEETGRESQEADDAEDGGQADDSEEDVGGDADEAVGDDEEAGDEEDVAGEPPAPRRGGGSQTIRALRDRAQKAEREAAELRGFQAGATSRQPAPDPQAAARAEQEFYASLELMAPGQAYQALMQRGQQQVGQELQRLRFEQQDLADQTRFEASCARSPIRESYREKVEDYRRENLRRGFIISRDEAFHLLYGRELEARANRAAPAQRRAAARRVAGQRTRPAGARSNMSPGSRRPAAGSAEADWAEIDAAVARGEKVF